MTMAKELIETKAAKAAQLTEGLAHFTGTDQWFKHFTGLLYTEGIQYLAKTAGAYWLIDLVASYQRERKVKAEGFQVWTLTVDEKNHAAIEMRADSDSPVIVRQAIEYTDFPLPKFSVWVVAGVMLLPSEY